MKRILTVLFSTALGGASLYAGTDAAHKAFLEPLQKRDSVLIADQLRYGVRLDGLAAGTGIALPEVGDKLGDYVEVVADWNLDTLGRNRKTGTYDVRAGLTICSFEEGEYMLPDIPVALRRTDGSVDTLVFTGQDLFVCTLPVDTADFKIHDIKAQMKYPVTFSEIAAWGGGILLLVALAAAGIYWWHRRRKLAREAEYHDPPHIVAMRKLHGYKDEKYWQPARQKAFYSGVTDTLRDYIAGRYDISAMEMTTGELMAALKKTDLNPELRDGLKDLFERGDFVKFAKHIATDEENATVVPFAFRFVSETYQEVLDAQKEVNNVL